MATCLFRALAGDGIEGLSAHASASRANGACTIAVMVSGVNSLPGVKPFYTRLRLAEITANEHPLKQASQADNGNT